MACEVNNKETNSQCAELLVRPTYLKILIWKKKACVYSKFSSFQRYKNTFQTLIGRNVVDVIN